MPESRSFPLAPLWLGLGGLIPFWGLAIALAFQRELPPLGVSLSNVLAAYAAVIASFLGGVRWGLAVAGKDGPPAYIASVAPCLLAWFLLVLPDPWRLGALAVLFLALGPVDARMAARGRAPLWFGRLRLILSSGAGIALLLGVSFFEH